MGLHRRAIGHLLIGLLILRVLVLLLICRLLLLRLLILGLGIGRGLLSVVLLGLLLGLLRRVAVVYRQLFGSSRLRLGGLLR